MTRIAALLFGAFAFAGSAQTQQPTPPERFVDVPENHWAYQAVESLRKRGIVVGYPDKHLRGKRTVTRYETAAGLNRFVAEADRVIQQRRSTAAPPQRGSQGPKGVRGDLGPPGPPGERPRELELLHELATQIRAEIIELRKQMDEAEKKAAESRRKIKE